MAKLNCDTGRPCDRIDFEFRRQNQAMRLGKMLNRPPPGAILDEPTRGVDVGAIVEIHQLINRRADEGRAVVVISSYLPEFMSLSDRILVARSGKFR